jgi:hypothetical protein
MVKCSVERLPRADSGWPQQSRLIQSTIVLGIYLFCAPLCLDPYIRRNLIHNDCMAIMSTSLLSSGIVAEMLEDLW